MNIAIIFAGGVGSRAQTSGMPKQFLEFHDKPILIHTIEHFERHAQVDAIALAMVGDWMEYTQDLLEKFNITKVRWLVEGGTTGQLSIKNALDAIEVEGTEDAVVLIHDGVRPLIDGGLITRNIEQAKKTGVAVTTYPTVETSVVSSDQETVGDVLDRSITYVAQAPQSFQLDLLRQCHEKAAADERDDFIDSCSLFRAYNDTPVTMVEGSRSNLKITTPDDFYIFEALYQLKEDARVRGL